MEVADKYIDQTFHYKGKWDVPGICGLKIIEKPENTIVIATNLYESNPGTSISRWTAQLANAICKEFVIEHEKLIFIERNPDRKSKLDFYKETFDLVEFKKEGSGFAEPVWKRVSKKEVDDMMT